MSDREVPTLIDALIAARRWTAEECVRHFADAAAALGESATLSTAQLKRWRRGRLSGLPRPTACRVVEHLFGYPVEDLFAPVPPGCSVSAGVLSPHEVPAFPGRAGRSSSPLGPSSKLSPACTAPAWAAPVQALQRKRPDPVLLDLEPDPIMSAAHDASEHAADAGRAIADTTLEQLHAEVARLAYAYAATSPVAMFAQLRRARNLTYQLLERTRRLAQTSDLYLVAGQLSGLMAGASYDLGYADAAAEQARAALTYGQVIDHHTLQAWARATLSTIAFWSGRPGEGVTHAQAGLEVVSSGDVAVRLHAVEARSWALADAPDRARAALRAAQEARDGDATDELSDTVGGEFTFGRARQELSAGATLLALGEGREAAGHARAAIEMYEELPVEQQRVSALHGARVDLATAHCLALDPDATREVPDLDAAREVLAPTFALAPEHRTERLTARMRALRTQVGVARFRGSLQAASFAEEIEEFTASGGCGRALPGGG